MPNVVYHADISDMSGKQVDQVYTRARSGPTRRSRTGVANPNTPAQSQARMNLALAAKTYSTLDATQAAAWADYARTQTARNPLTGFTYVPTANTVFSGLAAKFLQITPGGTIPLMPPTTSFLGDTITVTATGGAGVVNFLGSGANAAGVSTELLLQRLATHMRTPTLKAYRSQDFIAILAGDPATPVSVPPGVYAAAYRFVRPGTGQDSRLVSIGLVTVT